MKKTLTISLAFALVIAMSVAGTVAYLTSQDSVTNTFTVGKVAITLDEAKVDTNGAAVTSEGRVKANSYKLIPGHAYTKDPIIHVDANSEKCWLFVKVENGISAIEDSANSAKTIAAQLAANGWSAVNGAANVYAYKESVAGGTNVPVFGSFKIAGDADVANYENAKVVVTAYAVQADGFDTAAAAWTASGFRA